jgi:predicted dehydrogenase
MEQDNMKKGGQKLRVGIAGYGVVGRRRHYYIDKHPHMEVIAVCDQASQDISIGKDIRLHVSYHDLLSEALDVLFVCMPNDIAPEVTVAGLERGLHVFCEKPPGKDVADIDMVKMCEGKHPRLKLMYGFNHRYHESVVEALRIIRAGEMGNIINMRGVYGKSKLITFNQPDWRVKREVAGGGVLLDQGIHMVDLMRLFAGEFTDVYSFISNSHWGYDVEDNAYALMRTASGVVALLNSSATQWRHRFNLEITLDKGSIILGGILSGSKSYGAETLAVVRADPDSDNGDPLELLTRYNKDPSWEEEINRFADCILNDLPVESGSSEDALNTMRLVYKIYYADPEWRERYAIPNPEGIKK